MTVEPAALYCILGGIVLCISKPETVVPFLFCFVRYHNVRIKIFNRLNVCRFAFLFVISQFLLNIFHFISLCICLSVKTSSIVPSQTLLGLTLVPHPDAESLKEVRAEDVRLIGNMESGIYR